MTSYVNFTNKRKGTPKTHRWTAWSATDDTELGEIRWYGAWRKYVFEAYSYCYFDADCLEQIAKFCRDETAAAHKRWRRK